MDAHLILSALATFAAAWLTGVWRERHWRMGGYDT